MDESTNLVPSISVNRVCEAAASIAHRSVTEGPTISRAMVVVIHIVMLHNVQYASMSCSVAPR